MDKKKLVLWGDFCDYEKYRASVLLEQIKGNIEVVAVLFLDEGLIREVDGYPVIRTEELKWVNCDYIVGLEPELQQEMLGIMQMLRISKEKWIPGTIFALPNFDFAKYVRVREEHVSIISDNCWGGFTYHCLGMPFYSPFVNLFVQRSDIIKLMQNLDEYLYMPLEFLENGFEVNQKKEYPVCCLGDVRIHCNHYENYEQAKLSWDRRMKRLNWDNILVKTLIEDEKRLEEFRKIPYRKIGFSTIACDDSDVIDLSRFVKSEIYRDKYPDSFWKFVNTQAVLGKTDLQFYDTLKLLLGEEDYKRTVL